MRAKGDHRLTDFIGRIGPFGGSAIAGLSGIGVLFAQEIPVVAQSANTTGWVGIVMGTALSLAGLWFNDRRDKRKTDDLVAKVAILTGDNARIAADAKDARDELERVAKKSEEEKRVLAESVERHLEKARILAERVHELEKGSAEIPANHSRIAAVGGRVDAIEESLAAVGYLKKPPLAASYRKTVLVVEDDVAIAGLLNKLLTHNGFTVSAASTLEEGMAAIEACPDCAIVDVMLPSTEEGKGHNGIDILRKVLAEKLPVRVVMVTASDDPVVQVDIEKLAPAAYLMKPFDLPDLLGALRGNGETPKGTT